MKSRLRIGLVAAFTVVLVLAVGIGYAVAQSGGDNLPAPGQPGAGAPGGPGLRGHGPLIAGQVTKVENDTITLKTKAGDEKSVKVNDQTRYVKKGGNATLADVTSGQQVGILLVTPVDQNNLTARIVKIGMPGRGGRGGKGMVGNITAINGDTVTIHTANGDKQVKIPPLTQGERIGVLTAPDGTVRGVIYNPPQKPQGPAGPGAPAGGDTGTTNGATTTNGGGQGA